MVAPGWTGCVPVRRPHPAILPFCEIGSCAHMQVPQLRARRRRVAVAACAADQGRPDAALRGPAHHDGCLCGRGALLLMVLLLPRAAPALICLLLLPMDKNGS